MHGYKWLEAQHSQEQAGVTLRRLLVWSFEPKQRFRIMAILVDTARSGGLRGGALLTAISSQGRHGDPAVRQFVGASALYPCKCALLN